MNKKKLAVCAIFRNQAGHLLEWLAYHHLVGVEHFVLYDNASTDDPARVIRNSPLAEHVTLVHWPHQPGQLAAYRHFIDIFAPGFEWAAFIALDDFLLPLNSRRVVDTLDWLATASAVLVHQRVFGPGAWEQAPPGLVIENYDRRAADDFPANLQVRTIARCSELLDVTRHPDEFQVRGPVFNTAGHLAPNAAKQEQSCYQNLVINHYAARSRQAWLAQPPSDATQTADRAALLAGMGVVEDAAIKAFAPAVRMLMGLGAAAEPPAPMPPEPAAPAAPAEMPEPSPPPAAAQAEAAPGWISRGPDAQERNGGLGLVFRDRSRPATPWIAAMRQGVVAGAIDPAFLMDEFDRIRDFPSDAEARAACDAALALVPRH